MLSHPRPGRDSQIPGGEEGRLPVLCLMQGKRSAQERWQNVSPIEEAPLAGTAGVAGQLEFAGPSPRVPKGCN